MKLDRTKAIAILKDQLLSVGVTQAQLTAICFDDYMRNNFIVTLGNSPAQMPDSYYVSRLSQGKSIQQIAEELECHPSGVYRELSKRKINKHHVSGEDFNDNA